MNTLGFRGMIPTTKMPRHANMTQFNNLGAMLSTRPYEMESTMNQLFSAYNYFSDNPLSSIVGGMVDGTMEISNHTWEWKLKGQRQRPAVVLDNMDPTNNTQGRGRNIIRLKLDVDWFVAGDVLSPGTSGHIHQCRVQEDPVRDGKGFIYKVRLVNDDFKAFIPTQLLTAGQRWIKLFSTYEEGATQDGSTQYKGDLAFGNSLGKVRKKYEVTDYAAEETLAVKLQDSKGKMHDTWIPFAEVEYWQEWYRELEIAKVYNRKARSIKGSTGRSVDSFSGIHELLEGSHIHYYTDLTAELIEEFLLDIFYSRVKPGSGRKIKCFTGEYGMHIFNRAMQSLLDKRGWFIANSNFNPIQKAASPYTSNGYKIGYQFVSYVMANGAELELVHQPLYDDRELNTEIDPVTGYPIESMRFTFLDFTGGEGGSNIKVVNKKDGFKSGYVAGLINPFGPNNGGLMSHSGEYYSFHASKEFGIHIEDVTRCGELRVARKIV